MSRTPAVRRPRAQALGARITSLTVLDGPAAAAV
jgi:hypothetical protein